MYFTLHQNKSRVATCLCKNSRKDHYAIGLPSRLYAYDINITEGNFYISIKKVNTDCNNINCRNIYNGDEMIIVAKIENIIIEDELATETLSDLIVEYGSRNITLNRSNATIIWYRYIVSLLHRDHIMFIDKRYKYMHDQLLTVNEMIISSMQY